jgi:DNA recombination-dependent growth factor C
VLQIVREKEQQDERYPRKREKDNQEQATHKILPRASYRFSL